MAPALFIQIILIAIGQGRQPAAEEKNVSITVIPLWAYMGDDEILSLAVQTLGRSCSLDALRHMSRRELIVLMSERANVPSIGIDSGRFEWSVLKFQLQEKNRLMSMQQEQEASKMLLGNDSDVDHSLQMRMTMAPEEQNKEVPASAGQLEKEKNDREAESQMTKQMTQKDKSGYEETSRGMAAETSRNNTVDSNRQSDDEQEGNGLTQDEERKRKWAEMRKALAKLEDSDEDESSRRKRRKEREEEKRRHKLREQEMDDDCDFDHHHDDDDDEDNSKKKPRNVVDETKYLSKAEADFLRKPHAQAAQAWARSGMNEIGGVEWARGASGVSMGEEPYVLNFIEERENHQQGGEALELTFPEVTGVLVLAMVWMFLGREVALTAFSLCCHNWSVTDVLGS
eukprot:gnl/MRDRNA2_/MRDRNA2_110254_c0_seq1.p1 gnl/MRDRNA2_/MRDRNA2_110254_c0~~gnl/MRDRNA2_/MRDRNA2_110254_c0_seq1.p1  ORF type:complete len:399 (-),score=98.49 gnl/MRDRNA2_/MRDRNA2_110254_c0_seq1:118-1314(-)